MNIFRQLLALIISIGILLLAVRLIPIVFQIFVWIISITVIVALVLGLLALVLLWGFRD